MSTAPEAWQEAGDPCRILSVVIIGSLGKLFSLKLRRPGNLLRKFKMRCSSTIRNCRKTFRWKKPCVVSLQISTHVERNGSLSFLTLLRRSTWKRFIRSSRVGQKTPSSSEHFVALHGLADITIRRQQLLTRWKNQMLPLGAPAPEALGPVPEQRCRQFSAPIKRCLDWYTKEWEPLESELVAMGLRFRQLREEQPMDLPGGE